MRPVEVCMREVPSMVRKFDPSADTVTGPLVDRKLPGGALTGRDNRELVGLCAI